MEIKEAYCSFEVAKLLKEKGFKEFTLEGYDITGKELDGMTPFISWNEDPLVKQGFTNFKTFAKPTHQMAMAWLREKHWVISITPKSFCADGRCVSWAYSIWADDNLQVDGEEEWVNIYGSFEEATEAALKYCLENLI